MERILFASDLDNTLMFSHRQREEGDVCVERLEGRQQGFCTRRTLELLARAAERCLFVPVTSRSVEQYLRIQWPEDCRPRYAAAANGGVLLEEGRADPAWLEGSLELTAPWQEELRRLEGRLGALPGDKRFRIVDGLYLFAACDEAGQAQALGQLLAGESGLDTEVSGRKVYFFPPPLSKGTALERLKEKFSPRLTVCAGDSVIDVPMLRRAEIAAVPRAGLLEHPGVRVHSGGGRFSDFVAETVLAQLSDCCHL